MEKLPKGWAVSNIGELSKIIRGVTYKKNEVLPIKTKDSYLILRGGNIQDGSIVANISDTVYLNSDLIKDEQRIKKGDVIIVGSTGSKKLIGKAGIANVNLENISFGAFLMLVRPEEEINSKYFDYYFLSDNYRSTIRDLAGGININNIRKEYLTGLSFPLPPLAEQQRIVAKLDTLFASLEHTKSRLDKIPQLLKNFRQAVLTQAVTGKLTAEWREGKELEEWKDSSMNDLCLSITDGDHQAPPKTETGIPFLVISNVSKGYFDFDNVSRFVPREYYDALKETRIPRKGDVLYTVTGSYGISLLVDFDKEFCFQRHIAILKPNKNILDPTFLSHVLNSSNLMMQAHNVATGTAQKTVPLRGIKDFELYVPPLKEQTEIVSRLESLFAKADAIEQKYQSLKRKVDNLPQALLGKAFKGELVEQLPTDGDAKDLLAEIQKAKESLNAKSKGRKKKIKE